MLDLKADFLPLFSRRFICDKCVSKEHPKRFTHKKNYLGHFEMGEICSFRLQQFSELS